MGDLESAFHSWIQGWRTNGANLVRTPANIGQVESHTVPDSVCPCKRASQRCIGRSDLLTRCTHPAVMMRLQTKQFHPLGRTTRHGITKVGEATIHKDQATPA